MKQSLTLLFLCLCHAAYAQQQTGYPELSAKDSARVKVYWQKANKVPLHSVARQKYLDSALAIQPWNAYYWQQKSMPLSKMMKYELAQPFLDSAVKYNPHRYMDYRGYVNCIFRKCYRDALADFYAAKSLNGNSGVMDHPYDFYIGLSHLQLNQFDSCEWYMVRCIQDRTKRFGTYTWSHPLHWFYLANARYEMGNITRAITTMDTALQLNPTMPDVHYRYSFFLEDKEQYKEALVHATMADSLLEMGYSMNEDGGRYEQYPYQLNKYYLDGTIRFLKEKTRENR